MQMIHNDAISMTKLNKELVERTSAVIKYKDGQAYVAGESELTQVHKVNDVDSSFLKTGEKASPYRNLRNINYKMSYEDQTTGKLDNGAVRIQ